MSWRVMLIIGDARMSGRKEWGEGVQIPQLTLHVREKAPAWGWRDGEGAPGGGKARLPSLGWGLVGCPTPRGVELESRGKGRVSLPVPPCAPLRPPLRKAMGCWLGGGQLWEESPPPFCGHIVSCFAPRGTRPFPMNFSVGLPGSMAVWGPQALASGSSSGWLMCLLSPTPTLVNGGPWGGPWAERVWQTPQCMLGSHPLCRDPSSGRLPTQQCPGTGPEWVGKPSRRGGRGQGVKHSGARRASLWPSTHLWSSLGAGPREGC